MDHDCDRRNKKLTRWSLKIPELDIGAVHLAVVIHLAVDPISALMMISMEEPSIQHDVSVLMVT